MNPDKCKELRISFNAKSRSFDPIVVNGKELEVVRNFKLLGLNINIKLTWNHHIDDVVKKVNKRLCYIASFKVQFFCLLIGQKHITCRSAKRHV